MYNPKIDNETMPLRSKEGNALKSSNKIDIGYNIINNIKLNIIGEMSCFIKKLILLLNV